MGCKEGEEINTANFQAVYLWRQLERAMTGMWGESCLLFLNWILFLQILELTASSLITTLFQILVKYPGNLKPIEFPCMFTLSPPKILALPIWGASSSERLPLVMQSLQPASWTIKFKEEKNPPTHIVTDPLSNSLVCHWDIAHFPPVWSQLHI